MSHLVKRSREVAVALRQPWLVHSIVVNILSSCVLNELAEGFERASSRRAIEHVQSRAVVHLKCAVEGYQGMVQPQFGTSCYAPAFLVPPETNVGLGGTLGDKDAQHRLTSLGCHM